LLLAPEDFSSGKLTARSATLLARTDSLPSLRRLSVNRNPIGDDGFIVLADGPGLRGLEWLHRVGHLRRAGRTAPVGLEVLVGPPGRTALALHRADRRRCTSSSPVRGRLAVA